MTLPDYYRILEVSPDARQEVISAAYKELMKIYHPDRYKDGKRATMIGEAYEAIGDPSRREKYDAKVKNTPGKLVGNYRILEEIAKGGFGVTYKAEHVLTRELVCIKHCLQISPVDEALLLQEAKSIWDLRHFSIPVMRDVIRFADGSLGLVMSYVPGKTLAQIIEANGKIDPEHVAWIAERLLNVLKYLHFHGTVHGDMKPQNVILQPEDHTLVLVDFGLSLVKPTSTSAAIGYTDYFAAPEQIKGLPVVPETDFFGLGMTMAFALNGGDLNKMQRMEVPGNTPDQLVNFIKRLIAKEVTKRPNWGTEDLTDTIVKVRQEAFGRTRSNMKPLNY